MRPGPSGNLAGVVVKTVVKTVKTVVKTVKTETRTQRQLGGRHQTAGSGPRLRLVLLASPAHMSHMCPHMSHMCPHMSHMCPHMYHYGCDRTRTKAGWHSRFRRVGSQRAWRRREMLPAAALSSTSAPRLPWLPTLVRYVVCVCACACVCVCVVYMCLVSQRARGRNVYTNIHCTHSSHE